MVDQERSIPAHLHSTVQKQDEIAMVVVADTLINPSAFLLKSQNQYGMVTQCISDQIEKKKPAFRAFTCSLRAFSRLTVVVGSGHTHFTHGTVLGASWPDMSERKVKTSEC